MEAGQTTSLEGGLFALDVGVRLRLTLILEIPMPSRRDDRALLFKRIGPLGFGGATFGNLHQPISDAQAQATLATAPKGGIGYVDTAPLYGFGRFRKRIGRVVADHDRDCYVVISRVGRLLEPDVDAGLAAVRSGFVSPEPFRVVFDYSCDAVMQTWEASRRRLGPGRIDMLFAHDLGQRAHGADHPDQFCTFMDGGYRALRDLRDSREISCIGLGVNEAQVCVETLAHGDFDVRLLVGGPYNSSILATGVTAAGSYDYAAAPAAAALQFLSAIPVSWLWCPGSPTRVSQNACDIGPPRSDTSERSIL